MQHVFWCAHTQNAFCGTCKKLKHRKDTYGDWSFVVFVVVVAAVAVVHRDAVMRRVSVRRAKPKTNQNQ